VPELEIAVTSASAAGAAVVHGADRVELCAALELGGVTPSQAAIDATLEVCADTHVLVRARPGDFTYDADEVTQMARDAGTIAAQGAAGVVIGALQADGQLDLDAIARIADAARTANPDVAVTVHRAVDASADQVAAVTDLLRSGLAITRVLTSGGAAAAGEGIATIADMVAAAGGRIQIMGGGGVTLATIPVLTAVGVDAVHMSAKRPRRDHFELESNLVEAASALIGGSGRIKSSMEEARRRQRE
jgi:copper homeostasis protein